MAGFKFTKAKRSAAKLRLGLKGLAGTGKTYSALAIATGLGKEIVLIDTEGDSALKYGDLFDFSHCPLTNHNPSNCVAAINAAVDFGADVVIFDSTSHEWAACLARVDIIGKKTGNKFTAWGEVTPKHDAFIQALVTCPAHVIATSRTKQGHAIEGGKVNKVGLQVVQRDGWEYEFDLVGELLRDHTFVVEKSRLAPFDDRQEPRPGKAFGQELAKWLEGEAK